jgi:m7GpppX diphosphatase
MVKSLFKLTLIPFHRDILNPPAPPKETEKVESVPSSTVLSFLSDFHFRLTSESGAEYSYYEALPTPIFSEGQVERTPTFPGASSTQGGFKMEMISPATYRQIARAMPAPSTALVNETPEMYQTVTEPFIASICEGNSLSWICNVVDAKKEVERLLVNHKDFVLNVDTKWRSHPDALSTPRSEWYQHPATADLYCLGIVKQSGLRTLRDLRGEHVPMLKAMMQEGTKAIQTIYGIESNQIRVFVHYQPQFYHFHVHFTRLENEVGCSVERGHLVSDIVQNLGMDSDYYKKRTISFRLRTTDTLYKQLAEAACSEMKTAQNMDVE